jgi:hypothetical protein
MPKAKSLRIEAEGKNTISGNCVPVVLEFEPYGDYILVTITSESGTVTSENVKIEQVAINRNNLKAASLLKD